MKPSHETIDSESQEAWRRRRSTELRCKMPCALRYLWILLILFYIYIVLYKIHTYIIYYIYYIILYYILYFMIWYDMILFEMIWYDIILYYIIKLDYIIHIYTPDLVPKEMPTYYTRKPSGSWFEDWSKTWWGNHVTGKYPEQEPICAYTGTLCIYM